MVLSPYAAYVWIAYVISIGALAATVIVTLNAWYKVKRTLAGHEKAVQTPETNL